MSAQIIKLPRRLRHIRLLDNETVRMACYMAQIPPGPLRDVAERLADSVRPRWREVGAPQQPTSPATVLPFPGVVLPTVITEPAGKAQRRKPRKAKPKARKGGSS